MVQAAYKFQTSANPLPIEDYAPQTQKVKKIYRRKKTRRSMMVKTGLFLFCYALILVFICSKGASLNFQIVALEKDIAGLESNNARLEYEIAQATSLEQVEKIASRELGMHKSDSKLAMVVPVPKPSQNQSAPPLQSAPPEALKQGFLEKIYSALLTLAERNG